jgi:hypothetical protein
MVRLPAIFSSRGSAMPDVRCCECGYLSLREVYNRELYSPEANYRETGETPIASSLSPFPVCLMRACDFRRELKVAKEGHHSDSVKIVDVIRRDRPCDEFTTWQQGFSPKEHLEMNILKEQQAAHDKQAAIERQWRKEDTRFRFVELIVMGGIVTLVSVIVQIVAAFISRN